MPLFFNISKQVPMEEKQQQKKGAHNKSQVELLPSTQNYPGFSFLFDFFYSLHKLYLKNRHHYLCCVLQGCHQQISKQSYVPLFPLLSHTYCYRIHMGRQGSDRWGRPRGPRPLQFFNQRKLVCSWATARTRFASVVLERCPGTFAFRAAHCPCIRVVPGATHKSRLRPHQGLNVSAQKKPFKDRRPIKQLGGTVENSVSMTMGT